MQILATVMAFGMVSGHLIASFRVCGTDGSRSDYGSGNVRDLMKQQPCIGDSSACTSKYYLEIDSWTYLTSGALGKSQASPGTRV